MNSCQVLELKFLSLRDLFIFSDSVQISINMFQNAKHFLLLIVH